MRGIRRIRGENRERIEKGKIKKKVMSCESDCTIYHRQEW